MSGSVFVDGQRGQGRGHISEKAAIEVRDIRFPLCKPRRAEIGKGASELRCDGGWKGVHRRWLIHKGDLQTVCSRMGPGRSMPLMWEEARADWKLRQDERVVCMEKTNIRYVTPEDIGEPVDFLPSTSPLSRLRKCCCRFTNYLKDKGPDRGAH